MNTHKISWLIWVAIFLVSLTYVWLKRYKKKEDGKRLPPGPRGLPILGHLHMLGPKNPHSILQKLAQKHGPIMHLRLGGSVPTIVVSTPKAAELFLKTHDHVFASRPFVEAIMSCEQMSISFSEYGPYWRNMRKMCTSELLSPAKIKSFRSMREEEVGLLAKLLMEAARDGVAVDLTEKVAALGKDLSFRMILGKKYADLDLDGKGFANVLKELARIAGTPNIGEYIPYIGAFDLQGLSRRMKVLGKCFDDFFEKVLDDHVQQQSESKEEDRAKDFVDVLLGFVGNKKSEYRIERTNIKALLLDLLAGALDTTGVTMEWTLSELIKNPRVMKKVQVELESVVGMNRMVDESDLDKLEYFDMIMKETLRLHPAEPLLLPHQSMEDCTVDGYFIPKKSRIMINVWAVMRDPSGWAEPEKFWPERFEGTDIDIKGRDFQLIPFGSGRRGCPGWPLGLTVVRLMAAQLVHCFDWKLSNNKLSTELDMSEDFRFSLPRLNHLVAIPTYRLRKERD